MKISKLLENNQFTLVCGSATSEVEILTGYTSDLLSDVMAHIEDDSALITIQAHKNTIAVCSLRNAPLIVFCNSRSIPEDVVKAATDEDIIVVQTKLNQFQASHIIATLLEE